MADFEKHVAQRGDRRLFPVRVLDSILDDHVLLLEHVDAKPLSQMLLGASRARGGRVTASLSETMHRAGVLLRNFHEQPSSPNRQARGTTKDDFLAWIDMAGRLASQHPYGERVFQAHGPRLMELADQLLPTDLPIAPIHDDFAPRNVLVDPSQRVGIIDALEQWQISSDYLRTVFPTECTA